MREKIDSSGYGRYCVTFDSMEDFYKYLCDTPFNEAFRWHRHDSVDGDYAFTRTHTYGQAIDLFRNGWDDMAEKLTKELKVTYKPAPVAKRQTIQSVAGYQAIVPLYLAGVPTSMVNTKSIPIKQKVLNVVKLINYNCGVKTNTIIQESVKAMSVVKRLEAQGYRCNLYIGWGDSSTHHGGREIVTKIKIKSAGEKLNVSKLAFPMVHPSMLRRLLFRFVEVYPNITSSFVHTYGYPMSYGATKQALDDCQIVLPSIWDVDPEKLDSLEAIQASV